MRRRSKPRACARIGVCSFSTLMLSSTIRLLRRALLHARSEIGHTVIVQQSDVLCSDAGPGLARELSKETTSPEVQSKSVVSGKMLDLRQALTGDLENR